MNAGEALGKPRDFGQGYVGAISLLNRLDVLFVNCIIVCPVNVGNMLYKCCKLCVYLCYDLINARY